MATRGIFPVASCINREINCKGQKDASERPASTVMEIRIPFSPRPARPQQSTHATPPAKLIQRGVNVVSIYHHCLRPQVVVLIALMLLSIQHVGLVLPLLNAFHLVSGLVNFNTNVYWRSNLRSSCVFPSLHVATSTAIRDDDLDVTAAARATEADQFYVELEKAGLSLCHGALHASGCRRLADLRKLTPTQITTMGTDVFDLKCLHRVMADQNMIMHDQDNGNNDECIAAVNLCTVVNGVFVNTKRLSRFEVATPHDFDFQVISSEHDIFTGRLFTLEQCDVLNRMSEYHAYKGMDKVGAGWTNEICECIWGMLLVVFTLKNDEIAFLLSFITSSPCFRFFVHALHSFPFSFILLL